MNLGALVPGLKHITDLRHAWDFHSNSTIIDGIRDVAKTHRLSLAGASRFTADFVDPSVYCKAKLANYSHSVGVMLECLADNVMPMKPCTNCVMHAKLVNETHGTLKKVTSY
jgi:hypothetical protein